MCAWSPIYIYIYPCVHFLLRCYCSVLSWLIYKTVSQFMYEIHLSCGHQMSLTVTLSVVNGLIKLRVGGATKGKIIIVSPAMSCVSVCLCYLEVAWTLACKSPTDTRHQRFFPVGKSGCVLSCPFSAMTFLILFFTPRFPPQVSRRYSIVLCHSTWCIGIYGTALSVVHCHCVLSYAAFVIRSTWWYGRNLC